MPGVGADWAKAILMDNYDWVFKTWVPMIRDSGYCSLDQGHIVDRYLKHQWKWFQGWEDEVFYLERALVGRWFVYLCPVCRRVDTLVQDKDLYGGLREKLSIGKLRKELNE